MDSDKDIRLKYSKSGGFEISFGSHVLLTLVFVVLTVTGVLPNSDDWAHESLNHHISHQVKKATRKAGPK
jgi:hypothetical protein